MSIMTFDVCVMSKTAYKINCLRHLVKARHNNCLKYFTIEASELSAMWLFDFLTIGIRTAIIYVFKLTLYIPVYFDISYFFTIFAL